MHLFQIEKHISALPSSLTANTAYAVRVGTGFDLYLSDSIGRTAHKLNFPLAAVIETSRDLFSAEGFSRTYSTETQNRTSNYGTCITFSNTGEYTKKHGVYLHQFAFTTTGRILYSQSINGGQFSAWKRILLQDDFSQENMTLRAVKTANGNSFYRQWQKITGIKLPNNGSQINISHNLNINQVVSFSARVITAQGALFNNTLYAGLQFDVMLGKGAFVLSNRSATADLNGLDVVIYVDLES